MKLPTADLARRSLAEAMATFFLVFVGVGAIAADALGSGLGHLGISLAFGIVVAAMVYATGHVSGAHLNPAVTIAFAAVGRFPASDVVAYLIAQCTGAVLAAGLLDALIGLGLGVGTTVPSTGLTATWILEVVITFGLMFVIVAVATDDRSVPGFGGIAIGLAVAMGALAGGPFSGGSMNPARSLGPAVVTGEWTAHWIYWSAPFAGAALGALAYEVLRPTARSTGEVELTRPPTEHT